MLRETDPDEWTDAVEALEEACRSHAEGSMLRIPLTRHAISLCIDAPNPWPVHLAERRGHLMNDLFANLVSYISPRAEVLDAHDALEFLSQQSLSAPVIVAALIRHWAAFDPPLKAFALRALFRQAAGYSGTIPVAIEAFRDPDPLVRAAAVDLLGAAGHFATAQTKALCEQALFDRIAPVRTAAAQAIGEMRAPTPHAIERLRELLVDRSKHVQEMADRSLTILERRGLA